VKTIKTETIIKVKKVDDWENVGYTEHFETRRYGHSGGYSLFIPAPIVYISVHTKGRMIPKNSLASIFDGKTHLMEIEYQEPQTMMFCIADGGAGKLMTFKKETIRCRGVESYHSWWEFDFDKFKNILYTSESVINEMGIEVKDILNNIY